MKKNIKGPSRKKITRSNLEEQVRQQKDELLVRSGQLKQGVHREKLGAVREKLGAVREKLSAVREKKGAVREKVAEEQIHIRTKAMESTFVGIFIIDAKKPDFPIIYANPYFYNLTGYTKKDVIGRNYFLLDRSATNSQIYEEIKQTLCQGKSFHGEMLNSRKDGEKFWSLLHITPVCDKNGITTHYVGNKTDTTLMKQRDLEIAQQREELLHVTRVGKLAEFVSSLAHEISQPLTAILAYAQAAQRILENKNPQLQEILQYIINDDQRAAEVIRRLRVLLKKTKPTFESLGINILINNTVTLMMPYITARNKIIKLELNDNLPSIQGDQIQLQQVLLNLISNSLEAMEGGKDSHEMIIRTSRKNNSMILVQVTDSGCGIPAENMKKLFTHFFTNKPDGLGMGLSISRSIVEAHGGHLDAKNNPGRGATFYFTIPINIKKVQ